MEIYLVGGAVRDQLLGRPVKEKDWVVVGGTPAEMEARGFRQVGKSFPVFLHPETGDEYALARTETKTGTGYHGFDVYAGEDVTLIDDLKRRDLTINAIAQNADGKLIDPHQGRADLDSRILRHVSPAFREDPLRVLRVARFAASLHDLGFTIADETVGLLREMSASGELDTLVPERVWQETEKALRTARPDVFFAQLHNWGALSAVFPEIDRLFGVPQPERWHPEIDTGIHVLMVLRIAATLSDSVAVRFAAVVHDLGKGTTPADQLPQHHGHEQRGLKLIDGMCERLGIPNRCRDLGRMLAEFHTHVHRAGELRPATFLRVMTELDAFRRPERFEEFLLGCEADARGRAGSEEREYAQADIFRRMLHAAQTIDTRALSDAGLEGPEYGAELGKLRLAAITAALNAERST